MLSRFAAKIAIVFAMLLIGLIAGVIAVAFFAYGVYLALLNVLVAPAAAAITGVVIFRRGHSSDGNSAGRFQTSSPPPPPPGGRYSIAGTV